MTDRTKETLGQFKQRVSDQWREGCIAVPCTCEDGGGPTHWAMLYGSEAEIIEHLRHEKVLADLRQVEATKQLADALQALKGGS